MPEDNLEKKYIPRLSKLYRENIVPEIQKRRGHKNILAVPRIKKIAINMGVGAATADKKILEKCVEELALICGQKPKICRARKAISNFKLKEGAPIACCVTLRKKMMYEFLDRLITVATPRIRDFRGLAANSFDGRGNYTFGLSEQNIFPEINLDKVSRTQGMNISIHTDAKTDDEARELLILFGFPLREAK